MNLYHTEKLHFYKSSRFHAVRIPLFAAVGASFPSPADDYMEEKLDLNRFLIKNPSATFYVRVEGLSMTGAGIYPKDILIVDRSVKAKQGDIIIALVEGDFTVKRLNLEDGKILLMPENSAYTPIDVTDSAFQVWGVVIYVIHNPKHQ